MSDGENKVTETVEEKPALKVGGLCKVTNPTSSYFGQVGFLRAVFSSPDGAPIGLRPFWIEFTTRSGLHHCHTQCDFARDDVEPYESEDTEPQALVSTVETLNDDGMIEQLRKVLDEVQTNQAEHAARLDQLANKADLRGAALLTGLDALARELKELRDNAAADRLLIRNAEQEGKELVQKIRTLAEASLLQEQRKGQAEREIDRLGAQTRTAAEELWAQIERLDDRLDKLVDTKQPQKPAPSRLRRLKVWIASWARELAFRLDGCP